MTIDWNDLRFVGAVTSARSIARAAQRLKVDKSTVSRRISALEAALDVRIFDRMPNGFRLTEAGARVTAAAADVDRAVSALEVDLATARGETGGVVFLSVPQFWASRVLFPSLAAFHAAHPGVELVVNASSAVQSVAHREAEVGLRNVRPDQRSVTVKRLGYLASALYASRRYLAARGTPKDEGDLRGHDLVGWDRAFTFVPAFAWAGRSGARMAVRVNDAAVLSDAIAADAGIGVVPCILGDARQGLVRLDSLGLARDAIYAVAPGELRRSARVRAVLDLVASAWRANAEALAGAPKERGSGRVRRDR